MAKFNINLRKEYETLDKINDIRNYFEENNQGSGISLGYIQNQLHAMEDIIVKKMVKSIRSWGSMLLVEPQKTEFIYEA